MISGVLFQAVADIDEYLVPEREPYASWYTGEIREEIEAVKAAMQRLQLRLDTGDVAEPALLGRPSPLTALEASA